MNHEDEKGFLSNKFDDWSSEPIPNGWGNIESILEEDRKAGVQIWTWFIPLIFTFLGGVSYHVFRNTESNLISKSILGNGLENSLTGVTNNRFGKSKTEAKIPIVERNKAISSESFVKSKIYPETPRDYQVERVVTNHPKSQSNLISKSSIKTTEILFSEENLNELPVIALPKSRQESGISGAESILQNVGLISNPMESKNVGSAIIPENESEKTNLVSDASTLEITNPLQIEFLASKIATLETTLLAKQNLERIVLPPIEERKNPKRFSYWIGGAIGYSSRNVTINQIESKNTLRVQNISKPNESWFSQIQTHLSYSVKSWLTVFTGIHIGILNQTIQVEYTSKTPVKFDRVQKDSLNFSFSPTLSNSNETRKQELVYGNIEFGIKPLLSKKRNSGPFASVVVWSVISQKISNTNSEIVEIDRAKESVDLSYRIGYQHEIIKNLSAEVFFAGFPNLIASQSPGIKVRPNLIGFGLGYKLR